MRGIYRDDGCGGEFMSGLLWIYKSLIWVNVGK